ncbi:hypothetical protein I350_04579, partial [Cryptococcus amylolentus CBS 6273]
MIIVEVAAEAGPAQECTVYHNTLHRPCPDLSLLRPSSFLRELYHAAEEVGRTKAMLKQNFNTRSTSRKSSHAYWIRVNYPHRLPDDRTFTAAITTAGRHARFNRDPLMTAESIYERNKDLFLYFNKPSVLIKDANPTDTPDLRFECAVAPKAGLYAAIIYGRRHGLYMDTSWRHKTRYRSPVTILATRNDAGHMVQAARDTIIGRLRPVKYLLIDEVSVVGVDTLFKIHKTLQGVTGDDQSDFGGLNIIFAGDAAQLPAVRQTPLHARIPAPAVPAPAAD